MVKIIEKDLEKASKELVSAIEKTNFLIDIVKNEEVKAELEDLKEKLCSAFEKVALEARAEKFRQICRCK